jgi:sensor c-di-GMP phosphodiesterase-like protein
MDLLGKHLLLLDRQDRRRLIVYALTFIATAVALPIALSIYVVHDQGLESEKARALNYAGDALRRSETTTDQIIAAFEKLKGLNSSEPCSPKHIAAMRQLDLTSSYIQAIGHVEGNLLVCSSLGTELVGMDLGPVDFVQPSGGRVRTAVSFPFAPGEIFIVVERDGFAAIVHRDLPLDATTEVNDVSFAITSNANGRILTSRGTVRPQWLAPLPQGTRKTLVDDRYVVAIVSSQRHYLQAAAAVPATNLRYRWQQYAMLLIPIGLLVAALSGGGALFLARHRTSIRTVIRGALDRNEFFLQYQPIVDLRTNRMVGAEALIRWRRMKGEIVAPDRFIPVVEESGLSQWISRRVMELVAAEARNIFLEFPDFHLAINLTAADLHDVSTVTMLRDLASVTGAGPGNLVVEATERFLTEAHLADEVVQALRADGITVAIDDFGTGYSSLSYLEHFEFDTLKIDKAFIDTLNRNAVTSNVVLHIIEMGKALGKQMVAEGVESQEQAERLRGLGVQYAQGWLFSKPMSFVDLKTKLMENSLLD